MSKYKYCIVPKCTNTTKTSPNKYFFDTPRDAIIRKRWCSAMRRDDTKVPPLSSKSPHHVCQDHFNLENDTENYIQYSLIGGRMKLKKGVVPHIFECQKSKSYAARAKRAAKRERKKIVSDLVDNYRKTEPVASDVSQIEFVNNFKMSDNTKIITCDNGTQANLRPHYRSKSTITETKIVYFQSKIRPSLTVKAVSGTSEPLIKEDCYNTPLAYVKDEFQTEFVNDFEMSDNIKINTCDKGTLVNLRPHYRSKSTNTEIKTVYFQCQTEPPLTVEAVSNTSEPLMKEDCYNTPLAYVKEEFQMEFGNDFEMSDNTKINSCDKPTQVNLRPHNCSKSTNTEIKAVYFQCQTEPPLTVEAIYGTSEPLTKKDCYNTPLAYVKEMFSSDFGVENSNCYDSDFNCDYNTSKSDYEAKDGDKELRKKRGNCMVRSVRKNSFMCLGIQKMLNA